MPSVGTLYAIVSALGISFDELFFDEPRDARRSDDASARQADPGKKRTPSSHWQAPSEGPVLRAHNRPTLELATGVHWERLTATHDPTVEFLYCTYPVGGESCPANELIVHAGSEYGVLLEGSLGATVGTESYELGPGDSIAFESTTPHRIWTIGDQSAVAIWTVVGRDGDPRIER